MCIIIIIILLEKSASPLMRLLHRSKVRYKSLWLHSCPWQGRVQLMVPCLGSYSGDSGIPWKPRGCYRGGSGSIHPSVFPHITQRCDDEDARRPSAAVMDHRGEAGNSSCATSCPRVTGEPISPTCGERVPVRLRQCGNTADLWVDACGNQRRLGATAEWEYAGGVAD